MGEGDADGLEGLTPKEHKRFRRFRRLVDRFPQSRRVFGGGQRVVFRLTGGAAQSSTHRRIALVALERAQAEDWGKWRNGTPDRVL